ncbi:uncharacterized protein BP01DRAFT_353231 [Aspergillus saccharolyticus JOP 1030-1]|uniref:Uncharacterized protein n=1 Tax=Aspergillus saccharolyticus JOP 1030-1 TaxID=1450539 RepID=A0A318ZQK8_9EURO|nr:hypothetical protein BP01DRAFT_353231 [Aspergillus saccharolyticus JOP 1030-1]PYH48925.1 hypothetical protein BP01DRAFT_353231 [Aspergillus saccharolyticus JOP 1030-1]
MKFTALSSIEQHITFIALSQSTSYCTTILTMSTTTAITTTPSTTRVGTLSVLSDYELHHSGATTSSPSLDSTDSTTPSAPPTNWPTDHRRVPAYRPVNRNQNQSERPAGANGAEYVFIQTMLHGVWLNAVVSRIWHATGGKINDKIFHYEIGGEW